MDFEFWNNCWQRASQPFHVPEAHPLLLRNIKLFEPKKPVLLPLSGKSVDPIYLSNHGLHSVAVEFNPKAVNEFFSDNKLKPEVSEFANATLFQIESIDVWLADFFALGSDQLGVFEQVYDRASFVALPEDMRDRFVKHLLSLLSPKAQIFMVTMDYDPEQMSGPPFYISLSELQSYFPNATIKEIDRQSLMDNHHRWQELALDYLDEVLYQIQL